MVSVFFLEILPQIAEGEEHLNHYICIAFLIGVIFIHVLEKIVYKTDIDESRYADYKATFEAIGLVAYGLLLGVIIAVFFKTYDKREAYVFLIPFYVRAFGVTVCSEQIGEQICGKLTNKLNSIMQPAGPIIGTFFSLFLIEQKAQLFLVFSLAAGFILYIVVRDMIPPGREGKPIYFITGALITIAIFLIPLIFQEP